MLTTSEEFFDKAPTILNERKLRESKLIYEKGKIKDDWFEELAICLPVLALAIDSSMQQDVKCDIGAAL